jgi:outer membrane immunogenic protein
MNIMGNCTITIHATGSHHNHGNPNDINRMAMKFADDLKAAGHSVEHASITHGGREEFTPGANNSSATRAGYFDAAKVAGAALLAAILLWHSPTHAADVNFPAKAPVAAYVADPFSGWYLGANLGHVWNTTGQDAFITQANSQMFFSSLAASPQGLAGGIHGGYGQKFGGIFYAGIEADIEIAALHGNAGTGVGQDFNINGDTKQNYFGSVRARFGVTPIQNLLLYGTAGLGYGDLQNSFTFNQLASSQTVSQTVTKTGGAFGFGAEIALGGGWLARAEWIRYALGKATTSAPIDASGTIGTVVFDAQADMVRGGFTYKF